MFTQHGARDFPVVFMSLVPLIKIPKGIFYFLPWAPVPIVANHQSNKIKNFIKGCLYFTKFKKNFLVKRNNLTLNC